MLPQPAVITPFTEGHFCKCAPPGEGNREIPSGGERFFGEVVVPPVGKSTWSFFHGEKGGAHLSGGEINADYGMQLITMYLAAVGERARFFSTSVSAIEIDNQQSTGIGAVQHGCRGHGERPCQGVHLRREGTFNYSVMCRFVSVCVRGSSCNTPWRLPKAQYIPIKLRQHVGPVVDTVVAVNPSVLVRCIAVCKLCHQCSHAPEYLCPCI